MRIVSSVFSRTAAINACVTLRLLRGPISWSANKPALRSRSVLPFCSCSIHSDNFLPRNCGSSSSARIDTAHKSSANASAIIRERIEIMTNPSPSHFGCPRSVYTDSRSPASKAEIKCETLDGWGAGRYERQTVLHTEISRDSLWSTDPRQFLCSPLVTFRGNVTNRNYSWARYNIMACTCVVGLQWGDEAKWKIVDLLTDDHAFVVRYNGGANAGHTVVSNGQT